MARASHAYVPIMCQAYDEPAAELALAPLHARIEMRRDKRRLPEQSSRSTVPKVMGVIQRKGRPSWVTGSSSRSPEQQELKIQFCFATENKQSWTRGASPANSALPLICSLPSRTAPVVPVSLLQLIGGDGDLDISSYSKSPVRCRFRSSDMCPGKSKRFACLTMCFSQHCIHCLYFVPPPIYLWPDSLPAPLTNCLHNGVHHLANYIVYPS